MGLAKASVKDCGTHCRASVVNIAVNGLGYEMINQSIVDGQYLAISLRKPAQFEQLSFRALGKEIRFVHSHQLRSRRAVMVNNSTAIRCDNC
ncbi:hypothetical protein GCM10027020_12450 [Nocardioides salsibiostraticola]